MKLYYSDTSPYARKVRLLIIEKGLHDQVEKILTNPFEENPEFWAINPLGKIPALVLDNGKALFDSPVICRYLDYLSSDSDTPSFIPNDNNGQEWEILRWEALADGMTDAAYNLVMERRRPTAEQSTKWIDNWSTDIHRALLAIDSAIDQLGDTITLAHLALGAAIGYLDFRLSELLYEGDCPQVARYPATHAWYQIFKTRPSMLSTRPA